ncbi:hypothetical protein Tco_0392692 [Tanacetum coccineum]
MGKVPTEMELVLEQTQHGSSYEVSAKRANTLLSRITKLIADIEEWTSWYPADAMHNPSLDQSEFMRKEFSGLISPEELHAFLSTFSL